MSLKKEDYQRAADQLKKIHSALSEGLNRAKELQYKNMKKVHPGLWISKDSTWEDTMKFLKSLFPQPNTPEKT